MPELQRIGQTAALADGLDAQSARRERIRDTFMGLAMLFSGSAGLVLFGGWWTQAPLLMVSVGFALAPAIAFAVLARTMARAERATPRVPTAPAPFVTTPTAVRARAETEWRQAA